MAGADFSRGMLNAARAKTKMVANIVLVETDAGAMPFAACSFDAVTCSHAFYELKGETQRLALLEVRRVLKPDGVFFMMEHDVPSKPVLRALFYLRLLSMGAGRAISILKHEQEVLRAHFDHVEKLLTPTGHSKVWVCRRGRSCPHSQPLQAMTGRKPDRLELRVTSRPDRFAVTEAGGHRGPEIGDQLCTSFHATRALPRCVSTASCPPRYTHAAAPVGALHRHLRRRNQNEWRGRSESRTAFTGCSCCFQSCSS